MLDKKSGKLCCNLFAIFLTSRNLFFYFSQSYKSVADRTKKRVGMTIQRKASVPLYLAICSILKDVSNTTSRF
jgi:hypothetical protein